MKFASLIGGLLGLTFSTWAATSSDQLLTHTASLDEKLDLIHQIAEEQQGHALEELARSALIEENKDSLYELAYATKGFSGEFAADAELGSLLLRSNIKNEDPYAKALDSFIHKRTLSQAQHLLTLASSHKQRALAFMCLAEVYFARNQKPAALLYSVLSLATHPSALHDKQARFYLNSATGKDITFLQSRENLIDIFVQTMEETSNSETFRLLFDLTTVVSLLPNYPLVFSEEEPITAPPLEIFLGFDDGYAKHGGTTILSAILSADPNSRYDFKIIEDVATPISSHNKKKLRNVTNMFGDGRFTLEFVPVSAGDLPPLLASFDTKCWPKIVFYKLLIPQLTKGQPRSLWLDSDVIVRSDLSPLYYSDFQGAWYLGTRDVGGCGYLNNIGKDHHDKYLNVGVLLMNNEAILAGDGMGRLEKALDENPNFTDFLYLPEQDVIASLYQDHIQEIGAQKVMMKNDMQPCAEWNWYAIPHPLTHWSKVHNHFSKVVHMEGGKIKPWHKGRRYIRWIWNPKANDGMMNVYWALRDMGPWSVSLQQQKL